MIAHTATIAHVSSLGLGLCSRALCACITQVTTMSVGDETADSPAAATHLHVVLASATGDLAELACYLLPQMQKVEPFPYPTLDTVDSSRRPFASTARSLCLCFLAPRIMHTFSPLVSISSPLKVHSMRFPVPAPVRASYYDVDASHLYLLTDGPHARLLRLAIVSGIPIHSAAADAMPLPFSAMQPMLLPLVGSRELIAISDGSREHGATSDARSASTHGTNSRLGRTSNSHPRPRPHPIQERDCDLGRLYHPPRLRTAAHGLPRLLASQRALLARAGDGGRR